MNNIELINLINKNKNNFEFKNYINFEYIKNMDNLGTNNFKIIESCFYNNIINKNNENIFLNKLINDNDDLICTFKVLLFYLNKNKKIDEKVINNLENKIKNKDDLLISYIGINYFKNIIFKNDNKYLNKIFNNINIENIEFDNFLVYLHEIIEIPSKILISNSMLEKNFFTKIDNIFTNIIKNDIKKYEYIFDFKLLSIPLILIKCKFKNKFDFYLDYLKNYKQNKGMFIPSKFIDNINNKYVFNYFNLLINLNTDLSINTPIFLILEEFIIKSNNLSFSYLTQIFQKLTTLKNFNENLILFFVDFFKKNIENFNFFYITVKIIPSLSIVSKIYSNHQTNTLPDQIIHKNKDDNLEKKNLQIIKEISSLWNWIENFIIKNHDKIEISKLIKCLVFFIPIMQINKNIKIFNELLDYLKININKWNNEDISKLIYIYSRIKLKDDELFILLLKKFINLYNNKDFLNNITAIWGLSYSRFVDSDFINNALNEIILNYQKELLFTNQINLLIHIIAINKNIIKNEIINSFFILFKKNLYHNYHNLNLSTVLMNLFYLMCIDSKDKLVLFHLEEIMNKKFDKIIFDENNLYYIYLYFCHNYKELKLRKPELYNKIDWKLKENKKKLIKYFYYSKKINNSVLEINFKKLLLDNKLYEEKNKKIIKIDNYDYQFIYFENEKLKNDNNFIENLDDDFLIFPYNFDIFVDNKIIEVNGPHHYLFDIKDNKEILNGISSLKTNYIKKFKTLKLKEIYYKDIQYLYKDQINKKKILDEVKSFLEN